jgi:CubicO group peptidase (beta-lactamase class C family)
MRHPLIAISSAIAVAACASTPSPNPAAVRADRAEAALRERDFVGSALVACDDRILFSGDFGVSDPDRRIPSYWVASVSKQFAAAAILRLREQGRANLDDPLSRFFSDAPVDKSSITLTQLLTHQSGLAHAYAADGIVSRSEAAQAIFAVPLEAAPGAHFRYSNDNYALAAMIVEIASGQTYENFVRTELFEPAGLRQAGLWPHVGEDFSPPVLRQVDETMRGAQWGFRGSGGVRVSAPDLHRWVRALDQGRVLAPESVALLYGPSAQAGDGDGVGFGWFWSDQPNGRWLWTRGHEEFGGNAILYRLSGSPLMIIAATNAGPAEADGPGWSRVARDALMEIFDASACEGVSGD